MSEATDRELLEKAAKAAGMEVLSHDKPWPKEATGWFYNQHGGGGMFSNAQHPARWNPLADDGDALRLLARLRLTLDYRPGYVGVHRGFGTYIGQCPHDDDSPDDSRATRRAIVRAAAAIGADAGSAG